MPKLTEAMSEYAGLAAMSIVLTKAEAIALMVEMKADGKSLRAIAAAVARQGYKITHSGVAGILKAHKYDVWKVERLRAQAEEAEAKATGKMGQRRPLRPR